MVLRRKFILGAVAGLVILAGGPRAIARDELPASQPADTEGVKAKNKAVKVLVRPAAPAVKDYREAARANAKTALEKAKTQDKKIELDKALVFTLRDGRLDGEWRDPTVTTAPLRLNVTDRDGSWMLVRASTGAAADPARDNISLTRYDFDPGHDSAPYAINMNMSRARFLQINAAYGPRAPLQSLNFSQFANGVRLMIFESQNGRVKAGRNITAPTLQQLKKNAPDDVRRYLAPVLRQLTGEDFFRPGAAEVYQVFDDIPADPRVEQKIDELLPALDDPGFVEREAASKKLMGLGVPGLIAVLRLNRVDLSPEQQSRLDAIIVSYSRETVDPVSAREDVDFLLDCLSYPDLVVRQHAVDALSEATGQRVDIDPSLPDEKVMGAAEDFRKSLHKDEVPTTAPAADPNEPFRPRPGGAALLPRPVQLD